MMNANRRAGVPAMGSSRGARRYGGLAFLGACCAAWQPARVTQRVMEGGGWIPAVDAGPGDIRRAAMSFRPPAATTDR